MTPTDTLLDSITAWRADQLHRSVFQVDAIDADQLEHWRLIDGSLCHDTGGFFSIVGLDVTDATRGVGYQQPFILQPEVGILGFLLRHRGDMPELLVQAKTEPGNPGGVQLAPTFQCTESNYLCRHGGERAPYFDFFQTSRGSAILVDTLQSEQGTRFLGKYNRNMLVLAESDGNLDAHTDETAWRWLPMSAVSRLIVIDLLFNTDARSVLAVSDWDTLAGRPAFSQWMEPDSFGHALHKSYQSPAPNDGEPVLSWLQTRHQASGLTYRRLPLDGMSRWRVTPSGISPTENPSLEVRYFRVQALDREVPRWSQPLLSSATPGLVILIAQEREGVLHFLVSASEEPGFANRVQITTSMQRFPGEPGDPEDIGTLLRRFGHGKHAILLDCLLSEEGGRFFHDINRYLLVWIPADARVDDRPDQRWLRLSEINALKQQPGLFTNEFRSALSLLLRYL